MKKTLIFLGLLGVSFTSLSQIKVTQVHLSSGAYRQFGFTPSNITDFAPLAPGSSILTKDFSNYQGEMGYYNLSYPFSMGMQNISTFQSLQVGLSLPKCKGTLRLGISNFSNQLMSAYGSYYESHVVDTLISSQNGSMTFVDSTLSRNVYGNYSNQPVLDYGKASRREEPRAGRTLGQRGTAFHAPRIPGFPTLCGSPFRLATHAALFRSIS
jgi:hypothetical protein